jgi:hypothetical protein
LTTPEALFKGAAYCAAASKSNQGSSTPATINGGNINTDCLSNMKVCTWSLNAGKDWDPLFSDCSDDAAFTGVDGPRVNPTPEEAANCPGIDYGSNTPFLRTYRSYLGWGVNKLVAQLNGVDFCAGDAKA